MSSSSNDSNSNSIEELRERRRAKILASKDARLSRITGAHSNSSEESLKVDEVVIQEFIAEGRKQAVELAKEDYALTHVEHENVADESLNSEQVKQRKISQFQQKLTEIHQNDPSSKIDIIFSNCIVIISAISAAFFLINRSPLDSRPCFRFEGIDAFDEISISRCRNEIGPVFLQIVPISLVAALLPLLSDFFKGRKPVLHILLATFPRLILFLVCFIVVLRLLQ